MELLTLDLSETRKILTFVMVFFEDMMVSTYVCGYVVDGMWRRGGVSRSTCQLFVVQR